MPECERRAFAMERVSTDAGPRGLRFRGYAAVFKERAWIGDPRFGWWEQVAPGAFTRAIEEDDVRFLVNHNPAQVLARTRAGTLHLSEDKRGLVVEAELADVSYARDLAVLLERGDVNQMSFGFVPREDGVIYDQKANLRTLTDVRVFDVSATAFPAYEGTEAALRSITGAREEARRLRFAELRRRLEEAAGGR